VITIFNPVEDIEDDFKKEYVPYSTSTDSQKLRNNFMSLNSEEVNLSHSSAKTSYSSTPFTSLFDFNKTEEGRLADFESVEDVFQSIRGFFNATEFVYGGHRTNCYYRSENVVSSLILAEHTLTYDWFSWFAMLEAFDHFIEVPYKLHTITHSCYHGGIEILKLFIRYGDFVQKPEILLFNLLFNFGDMYDSARNIAFYFYYKPYTRVKSAFEFGFEIGNLARLIFYPKHEQLDLDIA
jgi:hypothetical protein